MGGVPETPLCQGRESLFKEGGVLCIDVLDALEAFEAGSGAGEEVRGGVEFFLALGGAGVGHEGVYYLRLGPKGRGWGWIQRL